MALGFQFSNVLKGAENHRARIPKGPSHCGGGRGTNGGSYAIYSETEAVLMRQVTLLC